MNGILNAIRNDQFMFTSVVYDSIHNSKSRIIVQRGGTRSTKTVSACQIFANWLKTGYIRKKHYTNGLASICSLSMPHLRATAMLEFEQILNKIGFYPKKYRDSWSYQGRTVEFFGLGDKTKGESSSNRVIGAGRDFLYVTEVDKITSETFRQLEVRTKEFVILDFNPTKPKPWIRTEIEEERKARLKDVEVFVSNYTHNPFLTKPQIAAIEYQRETNPNWFKAMGLGEYSDAEFLIFPNVHIIADEDFKPSSKNRFYGIDFGFSDPQTVIEVYEKENQIYINQVSYEQNQTIDQLLEVIHTRCDKKGLFVCDSSRPDSIQYLQNKKVAAIASKKGQGSILSGIAGIQTYSKINITVSSKETIEEFKNYSLLENDRPQDGNDHAIDPVRYVWLTCFSKGMRPILFG